MLHTLKKYLSTRYWLDRISRRRHVIIPIEMMITPRTAPAPVTAGSSSSSSSSNGTEGDGGGGSSAEIIPLPTAAEPKRTNDWSMYYLRRDLSERVLYILDRFENLRHAESEDVAAMENLWGCDFLLMNKELAERMKGGDQWTIVDGADKKEYADAVWPVDHAFVTERENLIELYRITSVSKREVRGKVSQVTERMVRIIHGRFGDNGVWMAYEYYAGLVNDKWVFIGGEVSKNPPKSLKGWVDSTIARLMPSILTARYEWHVALGTVPGGPRVLLPTNPAGCLQLFKNRNAPVGKTRRDKLRHWVNEHWRDDSEVGLSFVCSHLRGHTVFNWNDLSCELFVSEYDLEKNEYFRKQASEWRAKRKHNRVRIHLKRFG